MKNSTEKWVLNSDNMTIAPQYNFQKGDTLTCVDVCPTKIENGKFYRLVADTHKLDIMRKAEDRGDEVYFYALNPDHQSENFTVHKTVIHEVFSRVMQVESVGRIL